MTPQPELAGAEGGANALLAYLDAQRADRAAAWPEVLATTVVSLTAQFPHFHWTGIYLVRDDVLHLGPFVGHPTEHVAIPVGEGICGAAVQQRATIVVDDVAADPRYLACFASTRSEIVVPILAPDGSAIGEIDVDSDQPAAFTATDRSYLERVAERLAHLAPPAGDAATVPALNLARAERAAP
ncbi:MAG: GAF domain-containing protein [Ardenticatenales bacterium]|nr:GAF domain-containing protein [Ardenticatenales bacterium]